MKLFIKLSYIYEKYYLFITSSLRTAYFSMFFPIGKGTLIHSNFNMRNPSGIIIGKKCFININCFIDGKGEVNIGNDVLIGTRVSIFSVNHNFESNFKKIVDQGLISKKITIGNNVWIGCNVVILPGVSIGDGCVIAAGAVVTKKFGNNLVIGGIPAKIIKKRGVN